MYKVMSPVSRRCSTRPRPGRNRRPEMHGGHRTDDEPMAEMNMIPLIDIALTLLIIMMVTTAFIQKPGFNLNLPKAAHREGTPETAKDLVVGVDRAGEFYMEGQKKTLPEIEGKLKAA